MSRILIVEDEEPIVEILTYTLEREGYEVLVAFDGASGLQKALTEEPDLVLLDIMLPEMDGIEVCRRIREKSGVPIIMLTAKDSEVDKVLGLEMGADDYVTKPFGNRELVARIKANLRRHALRQLEGTQDILAIGDLLIDRNAFEVKKSGKTVELTHREYELLLYLAEHPGQVMTREHLLQAVWGFDYFGEVRTVDVTIRRLREKVEDDPGHPQIVLTKRGVGYTISAGNGRK